MGISRGGWGLFIVTAFVLGVYPRGEENIARMIMMEGEKGNSLYSNNNGLGVTDIGREGKGGARD